MFLMKDEKEERKKQARSNMYVLNDSDCLFSTLVYIYTRGFVLIDNSGYALVPYQT